MCQGRRIALFSERDPKMLDWESAGAEYIVESTGKMTTVESAGQHVKYGKARKVVISAPSKYAYFRSIPLQSVWKLMSRYALQRCTHHRRRRQSENVQLANAGRLERKLYRASIAFQANMRIRC